MKLTLKIKLLPNKEQSDFLLNTIKEANKACNNISEISFEKKIFNQFKLHKECYHIIRQSFNLTAQVVIRCISKVVDSYKLDRKVKRIFRLLGGIAYDRRILSYNIEKRIASIWTIGGRLKIPFVCHNEKYLPYIKGEADLVYKKGKFYLFQVVEIEDSKIEDVEEFIGVDFGQTDIAVCSDGTNYNSEALKKVRKKYSKVRASVQSKGTKNSKRLLKRLSGKERRFVTINNHTISKQIVQKAKAQNKGIAIENLTNIRRTAKPKSKAQKTELNRWSFFQLRQFLTYKALRDGVRLYAVPPAYTSQTCSVCNHIGIRKGKHFSCEHCGNVMDADYNASRNIATWGRVINRPENSHILSCSLSSHCV
jgi:IS605 OrfB family transposase